MAKVGSTYPTPKVSSTPTPKVSSTPTPKVGSTPLPRVGGLGDQLKSELQVVIGCITHFQNKGAVYDKTWKKMQQHMGRAIELYRDMEATVKG